MMIASCRQTEKNTTDTIPSLYAPPISVPINLKEGYRVNLFTGDSIPPLNNYLGDTIKTGVPLEIKSVSTFPGQAVPPLSIRTDPVKQIPFRSNFHFVPETLVQHKPDESKLKQFITRVDDSLSNRILNNYGDTILIGKSMDILEEYMPFVPSIPLPAQKARMRDRTTYDIQYLNLEHGMSSATIKAVLEDNNGNIWMGTDLG
ncbi:MAG TPA: two-component regulator propeller domain-containing protein, partial [Saprospiraceae bacterium]